MFMPVSPPFGVRKGVRRSLRGRARRKDRGASAVEFALVSPLVFTLLFGAIDYGLYFADALTLQQGVTDTARQATLTATTGGLAWATNSGCVTGTAFLDAAAHDLAKVVCQAEGSVTSVAGGTLRVKAEIVDAAGNPVQAWQLGNRLRLCAIEKHDAVLPFVPLPDGGLIRTRVDMPIQGGPASLLLSRVEPDVSDLGTTWSC